MNKKMTSDQDSVRTDACNLRNEMISSAMDDDAVGFGATLWFVVQSLENPFFRLETFNLLSNMEKDGVMNREQLLKYSPNLVEDNYKLFQLEHEDQFWTFRKVVDKIKEKPGFDRRDVLAAACYHGGGVVKMPDGNLVTRRNQKEF